MNAYRSSKYSSPGIRYQIKNIYAKGKIPTNTDHPLQICGAPFCSSPERPSFVKARS